VYSFLNDKLSINTHAAFDDTNRIISTRVWKKLVHLTQACRQLRKETETLLDALNIVGVRELDDFHLFLRDLQTKYKEAITTLSIGFDLGERHLYSMHYYLEGLHERTGLRTIIHAGMAHEEHMEYFKELVDEKGLEFIRRKTVVASG
jgi:hypothetical protein